MPAQARSTPPAGGAQLEGHVSDCGEWGACAVNALGVRVFWGKPESVPHGNVLQQSSENSEIPAELTFLCGMGAGVEGWP